MKYNINKIENTKVYNYMSWGLRIGTNATITERRRFEKNCLYPHVI